MASVLRSSLARLTHVSIKKQMVAATNKSFKQIVSPKCVSRGLTLNKNFASLSSQNCSRLLDEQKRNCNKTQTCSIQTEGQTPADGKLSEFLSSEISNEKEAGGTPFSKVEGWETKTDGTGVTLTKKFNDEVITVEFDVNDSVNEEPVFGDGEDKGPSMVARPPFEVQIKKKSGRKLTFMCEFNEPEPSFEEAGGPNETDIEDQFNIIEVRVDEPTKSGEMENFYTHNSSVMDGTLYDLLMDMLDERGIDDAFINNMVDFATSYEHQQYVNFLEKLKNIIREN